MILGVTYSVWAIILVCVGIAFLYAVIEETLAAQKAGRPFKLTPGRYRALALCLVIAVVATVISKHEQYVGASMMALIIGIALVNCLPKSWLTKSFTGGTSYVGKKIPEPWYCVPRRNTVHYQYIVRLLPYLPLVIFNVLLAFLIANLVGPEGAPRVPEHQHAGGRRHLCMRWDSYCGLSPSSGPKRRRQPIYDQRVRLAACRPCWPACPMPIWPCLRL